MAHRDPEGVILSDTVRSEGLNRSDLCFTLPGAPNFLETIFERNSDAFSVLFCVFPVRGRGCQQGLSAASWKFFE